MNVFKVDVETHDANNIMCRIARLASTESVESLGAYWTDTSYTLLLVHTTKTEDELDDWLWRYGFDYVGVVQS